MDDLARGYLELALALGNLQDGVVDAYYGPAEIREAAKRESVTADEAAQRASSLRSRVAREAGGQRAAWLSAQLQALETIARRLAGQEIGYLEEVERCFDATPEPTPAEAYARVHAELDVLLPPGDDLRSRLAARDKRLEIPAGLLPEVVEFIVADLERRCRRVFGVPAGESLAISFVKNEPWAAYNWYEGNLHSRIEINTDLPVRATGLIGLLSHEAYPGHHLEHAWKEQRLLVEAGRAESAVQLINTPEAYISEGLAELGRRYVLEPEEWQGLLVDVCTRSGLEMTPEGAAREWRINQATRGLRGSSGDAALMLHVEGRSVTEVHQFLERQALRTPEQADKDVSFITHPLWRAYVFCYAGGELLLQRWCAAAGDLSAQRERFFRLLSEQLTPSEIRADLAASGPTTP